MLNVDLASERPCLVLQTRRHVTELAGLTPEEASELGVALARLTSKLRILAGAEKVYVYYLNETTPAHVHLHLVPRYAGDAPGPDLIDRPAPSLLDDSFAARAADAVTLPDTRHRDRIVRVAAAILTFIQTKLSPHRPFGALWRQGRRRWGWTSEEAAPVYVLLWLVSLAILLGTAGAWQHSVVGADTATAIAFVRYLDLVTFHLRPLVDAESVKFAAFRRSLLLLMLNVAEMTLIVGVLLAASAGVAPVRAWLGAFFVITATSTTTGTVETEVFQVLGVVANLLLLAVGLATWVSLISQQFEERRHEEAVA